MMFLKFNIFYKDILMMTIFEMVGMFSKLIFRNIKFP